MYTKLVSLFFIVFIFLIGCGTSSDAPIELRKAKRVVQQLTSVKHLRKSGFLSLKDKKPSTYLSYMFSTMGSAEWPPHEDSASPMEREQMKAIGVILMPKGVKFFPHSVHPDEGMQLVISADDAKWLIIVKGYVDPSKPPVLKAQWNMPKFKAK